jgi:hypothetical protein
MKPATIVLATSVALLSGSILCSCDTGNARPLASAPQFVAEPAPSQQQTAQVFADDGAVVMRHMRSHCPMVVDAVTLVVADTDGGIELAFMTSVPNVAELRIRVRTMAQTYESHQNQGSMMWQPTGIEGMGVGMVLGMGTGMGTGAGMGLGVGIGADHMTDIDPMPAVTATVTDTERGASVELRPVDPTQLNAVREHVREHEQRMNSGECWMIAEQPSSQSVLE